MNQALFYTGIIGFSSGIALRSLFDFGLSFAGFLILLGVVLTTIGFLATQRMVPLVFAVFFLLAGLGVVRMDIADVPRSPVIEQRAGSELTIEGVIVDEPDVRASFTQFPVKIHELAGEPVETRILVRTDPVTQHRFGDRIEATGQLQIPEAFETETGRTFNYPAFLEKDGIHATLAFAETEILARDAGDPVRGTLFALKRLFLDSIGRLLPDPESSLLGGLVVGAKEALGDELLDAFRITGIIHIVVLSGYNVTIVAEGIMRTLAAFVPFFARLAIGGTAIVLFALMTGASATIVRASLMAILVLLARATGRTYDITRALFVAGIFMLIHNPHILLHDPSFQLSFIATLGLIWLAPFLERVFTFAPTKWQIREFITATVATQLFVLPLLLWMTGEISVVAVVVNVLILGVVPVTMLLGFLAGMVGLVSRVLALPLAFVTFLLLAYQLLVVDVFASLPFAAVVIGQWPLWATFLIYGLYAVGLWWLWKRKTPLTSSMVFAKY